MDEGVGDAVGRHADADRHQLGEARLVEPDPQPDAHDGGEHHRVGVVDLPPIVRTAVMAAVQAQADAVHHEAVGRRRHRLHRQRTRQDSTSTGAAYAALGVAGEGLADRPLGDAWLGGDRLQPRRAVDGGDGDRLVERDRRAPGGRTPWRSRAGAGRGSARRGRRVGRRVAGGSGKSSGRRERRPAGEAGTVGEHGADARRLGGRRRAAGRRSAPSPRPRTVAGPSAARAMSASAAGSRRVPAADRDRRVPVAGEVEGGDRARSRRRATTGRRRATTRRGRAARAAAGRRRRAAGAGPAHRLCRASVITAFLLDVVEHEPGDEVGRLDVHEVADVVEDLEPGAGRQVRVDPLGIGAPSHLLGWRPSTPRNGIARPGSAAWSTRPPRPEAAEAHGRVDLPAPAVVVVVGRRPRRGSAATPGAAGGSSGPRRAASSSSVPGLRTGDVRRGARANR